MALFGMEHYEVILVSWIAAAVALGVVSVFSLAIAIWATREPRPAPAARRTAGPAPARAHTSGTPVGVA